MKSTEFHRALRAGLATWAKPRAFARVSSAPPAFELEFAPRAFLSIRVQLASGGYDPLLGGGFTVHVQVGPAAVTSHELGVRLPKTWSDARIERALALDARVRAKRTRPRGPHPFERFATREQIEARYYAPISALPIDYWPPYVDADDVTQWTSLVVESLDDGFQWVIERARARDVMVPASWPPAF